MTSYLNDDPIYALCTAYGVSAIATHRVSGKGCIAMLNQILDKRVDCPKSKEILFRRLVLDGDVIDDAVLSVFAPGHGYTREESVEISTHGSIAVINSVDKALCSVGFRKALGGEFTYRAMRSGALSMTQAESVLSLINSRSEDQRRRAYANLAGSLDSAFRAMRQELLAMAAAFELQLDYDETEYDEAIEFPSRTVERLIGELTGMLKGYEISKRAEDGIRITLFGKANEGKSSLFNHLLKQERSIVSNEPGTTRDFIGERVEIKGFNAMLYDTAGMNEASGDEIESEGMRRSVRMAEESDALVFFTDGTSDSPYERIARRLKDEGKFVIRVRSKADLRPASSTPNGEALDISCVTGEGIGELVSKLAECAGKAIGAGRGDLALESARQQRIAQGILDKLRQLSEKPPVEICAMLLRGALEDMCELSGEDPGGIGEETLNEVFSRFCVGK